MDRNLEALNAAATDEEARVCELESKLHSIALRYLIWERSFFFSVSHNSSSHKCVPLWIVVGLSLSCSALYLLMFLQNVSMMFRSLDTLNMILRERALILEARNEEGYGGLEVNYGFQVRELNNGRLRIAERKVYICAIACALVAVTAFEVCACTYSVSLCE
ncbi:hypothetical protein SDJN03_23797, partial [Cucurbita argyrosperma subsp. sororia]